MEKYVSRPKYLDFLTRWQDKKVIKVVSGVRRAGKSTLFYLFRRQLKDQGINDNQLININFENMKYDELRDPYKLYDYLESKITEDKKYYIFLDEIQHVKEI